MKHHPVAVKTPEEIRNTTAICYLMWIKIVDDIRNVLLQNMRREAMASSKR